MDSVVSLRGNVSFPGRYAWHAGMRVRDLISSREALITRHYSNSAKNFGKQWGLVPREDCARKEASLEARIREVARSRGKRIPATRGQAFVRRKLGSRNDSAATGEDLSTVIIPFNLGQALSDQFPEANLELKDHDVITVFALRDLEVPTEKHPHTVHIEGEVNAPGAYTAAPGETLRDMVIRAGGLTPAAYLFATDFRRESTRREQQKQIEQIADAMDKDLRAKTAALPKSNADERAAAQEQLASERNVLEKLRQTKATGRIVLEVSPTDADTSALPALRLEDGDRLIIPPRPATVEVVRRGLQPELLSSIKPAKRVRGSAPAVRRRHA